MDMRVAGSLVMDSKVGAHSFVYKVVIHIGTHKGKLLFAGQFTGQGDVYKRQQQQGQRLHPPGAAESAPLL